MSGREDGDADEFDRFIAGHGQALARMAWVVAGGRSDGEDLLQSTLISVWRHWGRVRDARDPHSYVCKMLINEQRNRARSLRAIVAPARVAPAESLPYEHVDTRITLDDALRRLPVKQRSVIALRFLEELSERETAAVLGCSVGTVKSHTSRAIASLRRSPVLSDLVSRDSGNER